LLWQQDKTGIYPIEECKVFRQTFTYRAAGVYPTRMKPSLLRPESSRELGSEFRQTKWRSNVTIETGAPASGIRFFRSVTSGSTRERYVLTPRRDRLQTGIWTRALCFANIPSSTHSAPARGKVVHILFTKIYGLLPAHACALMLPRILPGPMECGLTNPARAGRQQR
jgi:hypothetical protein